jgi:hypothetical protein
VTGGPQGSPPGKRGRLAASADLVREREVRELAGLLAEVVELASSTACSPGAGSRSPRTRRNTRACAPRWQGRSAARGERWLISALPGRRRHSPGHLFDRHAQRARRVWCRVRAAEDNERGADRAGAYPTRPSTDLPRLPARWCPMSAPRTQKDTMARIPRLISTPPNTARVAGSRRRRRQSRAAVPVPLGVAVPVVYVSGPGTRLPVRALLGRPRAQLLCATPWLAPLSVG